METGFADLPVGFVQPHHPPRAYSHVDLWHETLQITIEDRVGLLSEVTRIFRENGLSVTQAEVTTRGSQAVNVFYVTDVSGHPVKSETIEVVRKEIGLTILRVKDDAQSTPPQENGRFSLGNLFRSRSEKFLYNLGLIKSYSWAAY